MNTEILTKRPCPCGCRKFIVGPYFGCQCSSVTEQVADELIAMSRDAQRYRWLRDGNAYAPEEGFARGGEDLDKLCDQGIRDQLVREEKENAS